MDLNTSLSQIPKIGTSTKQKLEKLGLFTVSDLIYHFPFRYDDFSTTTTALETKVGEKVTLQGEIWSVRVIRTRTGKMLIEAVFNDGTYPINLTWFNQSWIAKQLKTGDKIQVSGKLSKYKNKLSIVAPVYEKITVSSWLDQDQKDSGVAKAPQNDMLHTGRIVPIYPETQGLTSKWIRTQIDKLLQTVKVEDFLPDDITGNMLPEHEALNKVHFPESLEDIQKAHQRLGFDELFLIQLATTQTRMLWKERTVVKPWIITDSSLNEFLKTIPFDLTNAQKRVINEIIGDLRKSSPMNRLVQGEVGSGKTMVAAAAMYLAHLNGFQSLLMAPTEILAWQHYNNIKRLMEPLGINVGIYTGSRKYNKQVSSSKYQVASKKNPAESLNTGYSLHTTNPDIIIGTHALITEKFKPEKVGLVVIDEQHRFGVEQRTLLRSKGASPHLLTMTATPIPRTVALTLYGDLDISIIDELPKNRPVIKTHVVPEQKRDDAYKFIEKKIKEGDQAYIITPLIEEPALTRASRGRAETLMTSKAAKVEFEKLKTIFPKLKLGLLHGRMKAKEKEEVLENFRLGKLDILVSTTVVEVGVDVPNATIIVIEGADRFGLAQLHQLRGRVGRGTKESYCLLFAESKASEEGRRLKFMENTFDGLKLAELDLKIRGSGTIFGTSQHGRIDLKIAKFSDLELIEQAKKAASKILQDDLYLDKHPALQAKLHSISSQVMPD